MNQNDNLSDKKNLLLEAKNLSVGYNSLPLLKPFSFSVRAGEIVSLIGANGSGKSTILKTISGQLEAIGGAIYIEENELKSLSPKEISKKIAVLLTSPVRPELLSARDVVASGRYPHTGYFGFLTSDDKKAVDEAIRTVQAEDFSEKDFMRLSDGQKQRIMFARALVQNPSLLVLDEPTSFLDIKWRLELLKILRDLCKNGVTVIASLHEIDLALKISDRILCVGQGEVCELSREESKCKAQIRRLYDLNEDFFETESVYAELVREFCKQKVVVESVRSQSELQTTQKEGESLPPASHFVAPTPPSPRGKPLKPQASLMVQGTMSSAGKSFLVAGLCRIFAQDGFSVAPFKSQNMALNSFVTNEGLEMGRAQVMQAEAAGVEPSVLMNPILLKPNSDTGSQVIVNGEVLGDMSAKEYFSFKKSLVPKIKSAYEKLSAEHEIIVIEGAGSPAEINLKENDIVNMGMAEIADSPVILIADIDRGGVFAQILGTVELLKPNERSRVKGFVINKFRGDKSILDSGIKMIEQKIGIPCLGTVPYIKINLDDEDSLSENLHILTKFRDKKDEIQLAVVSLPHISNFTDFIPLQNQTAVNLYYVKEPKDLGFPDCIIIPGTKNTLADLNWLKKIGLAEKIQAEAKKGTPIIGICGGFQILGEKLLNEELGMSNEESGLSLLPVETSFSEKKVRTRVSGKTLSNLPVSGYEIHQGLTEFVDGAEKAYFAQVTDSVSGEMKFDGAVQGNVFGTYIHGLFDEAAFREKFIEILARRKGIDISEILKKSEKPQKTERDGQGKSQIFNSFCEFKENQYNLLAKTLRENLDMKKIYGIMGLNR